MPQLPRPDDPIPDILTAYQDLLPDFFGATAALLFQAARLPGVDREKSIGRQMLEALCEGENVDWLLGPNHAAHPVLLEGARRALLQARGGERTCLEHIVAFLEGRWRDAGPLSLLAPGPELQP